MFLQNTTNWYRYKYKPTGLTRRVSHMHPLSQSVHHSLKILRGKDIKGQEGGGESHTSSSFCLPAKFWLGPDAHSNDGKTNLKHWICRKELGSKELTELLVQISKNIAGWPYCTWPSGHVQTFFSRLPIRLENTSTHRPAQAKIPKYLGEQHWRGWWFLPYFILMCQMM